MSKICKLWVHRYTGNQQDVLIPAKDFSNVIIGDILEIYHPEDEFSRLLLQVSALPEDFQQKDTISIEQSIASTFQLRAYKEVIVNKIEPENVALAMVELLFKEQYFNRSEMWRLIGTLKNTCVYLNKKIEFAEMRCQVNEMWSKGEKVACGVITKDTRVVYRSSTAVVQIFIQLSSEMWEFDLNGDLYFEKAVNGFLTDLFAKWKDQNCSHDVTIVLFSRTYYETKSLEDFPPDIRDCLQADDQGNIYEDYYRVIVQNERYDEWAHTLRLLRKLFNKYPELVLSYHQKQWPNWKMPAARISTAAKGNFLETLNMSLNLFENYFLDRNFDRTGKVSVVITPGPGVFEVDRELTFITKQRTIDCGVGSDLVCMGEQPLHAVPLFKFRSKNVQSSVEVGDDYNIPHWMNHSFYTSKNQIQNMQNAAFIPRIKPPPEYLAKRKKNPPKFENAVFLERQSDGGGDNDNFPFVDYDEYDAQVFKLPSKTLYRSHRSASCFGFRPTIKRTPKTFSEARLMCGPRNRHISDGIAGLRNESSDKKAKVSSSAISIPSSIANAEDTAFSIGCYPILENTMSKESFDSTGSDDHIYYRPVVGSAGSPVGHSRTLDGVHRNRALINPFAPSRLQFKMTSNRRRWVHALPTDAKGATVQPHHVQPPLSTVGQEVDEYTFTIPTREVVQAAQMAVEARQKSLLLSGSQDSDFNQSQGTDTDSITGSGVVKSVSNSGTITPSSGQRSSSSLLKVLSNSKDKYVSWVPTGEQEWTPDFTTGWDWRPLDQREVSSSESQLVKPVFSSSIDESDSFCPGISVDWKSLTIPACLPITTDYFPEERSLQYDYVIADYTLLPDDMNSEYWNRPPEDKNLAFYRRPPLTTDEAFRELISQRLGQGFQLIVSKKNIPKNETTSSVKGSQYQHAAGLIRARQRAENEEEYYLSIGRIFHKLKLSGPNITVTRIWPRHPPPHRSFTYRYRFQAPDSYCYDASSTMFFNEQLEMFNWNYLDQYICTRGESDYGLTDTLKYWRSRFFLVPCANAATKKIVEGQSTRCDIYEEKTPVELKHLAMGFIRFVEIINKLKRSPQSRRSKVPLAGEGTDTSPSRLDQEGMKEEKITLTSPNIRIVEALLDPQSGLSFFQGQQGLPGNCFISAEAVMWCQQHVIGVQTVGQAVSLLQRLLDDQLILHASGNPCHMFIYGFYLYYITLGRGKTEPHVVVPGSSYNTLFQNEWLEVSFLPTLEENAEVEQACKFFLPSPQGSPERVLNPENTPASMLDDWREQTGLGKQGWGQQSGKINVCAKKATLFHKYVNVDVNPSKKSERQEWATARYNAYYSPHSSFELQVQWMVATGCVLGDLIYSWTRKVGTCGYHMIPVPVDPFALPNCINSDPLRGPIFIPLELNILENSQDCTEEAKQERLLEIQDSILKRFGFVPCNVVTPDKTHSPPPAMSSSHLHPMESGDYAHQYVHCTVGMFVLIPELKSSSNPPSSTCSSSSSPHLGKKSSSDMHKDYIARQQSNLRSEHNYRMGFLWSWNFMSSRRWRSQHTGDEQFQDRMLADFREFCQCKDGRLLDFLKDFGFST